MTWFCPIVRYLERRSLQLPPDAALFVAEGVLHLHDFGDAQSLAEFVLRQHAEFVT